VRHEEPPRFEVRVTRNGHVESRRFEHDQDAAAFAIQERHAADPTIE
jgi:hypothetical protein